MEIPNTEDLYDLSENSMMEQFNSLSVFMFDNPYQETFQPLEFISYKKTQEKTIEELTKKVEKLNQEILSLQQDNQELSDENKKLRTQDLPKNFKCFVCKQAYRVLEELDYHCTKEGHFCCKKCTKKNNSFQLFFSRDDLYFHLNYYHQMDDNLRNNNVFL
jgi:hypothetical protein